MTTEQQCVETMPQADESTETGAAGNDEFHTGSVVTIAASHALHDTYSAFLAPLLPAFIASFSLSNKQAGLLSVLLRVPSLTQPLIGHMSKGADLRYLVVLGPAITATMMSLLGIAPGYAALAALLIVVGFSSAVFHATGPVMAGRMSGRNLGRGMGLWMVGGELGRALGPIVIVTAVKLVTLKGTPWLMVGGWIASVLLYRLLKDTPGRSVQADQVGSWQEAVRSMRPILLPLMAILLARSLMIAALNTYLPAFLSGEGADLWFAGASLSVLEVAGVVGALLGGSLSDRLGRRTMLAISLSAAPLFMLLFLVTKGWGQFPLLMLLGLTGLSASPVLMAVVQETSPENRAMANGAYMAMSFLISSAAALLVGAMGDSFGLRAAFYVSAVMPLVGLPFVHLLRRKVLIP